MKNRKQKQEVAAHRLNILKTRKENLKKLNRKNRHKRRLIKISEYLSEPYKTRFINLVKYLYDKKFEDRFTSYSFRRARKAFLLVLDKNWFGVTYLVNNILNTDDERKKVFLNIIKNIFLLDKDELNIRYDKLKHTEYGNINDFDLDDLLIEKENKSAGIIIAYSGNSVRTIEDLLLEDIVRENLIEIVFIIYLIHSLGFYNDKKEQKKSYDKVVFPDFYFTQTPYDKFEINNISFDEIDFQDIRIISQAPDKEEIAKDISNFLHDTNLTTLYKNSLYLYDISDEYSNVYDYATEVIDDKIDDLIDYYYENGLISNQDREDIKEMIYDDIETEYDIDSVEEYYFLGLGKKGRKRRAERKKRRLQRRLKRAWKKGKTKKIKRIESKLQKQEDIIANVNEQLKIREKFKEKKREIKEKIKECIASGKSKRECKRLYKDEIKSLRKERREKLKELRGGMTRFGYFMKRIFPTTAIPLHTVRVLSLAGLRMNLFGYSSLINSLKDKEPEKYEEIIKKITKKFGFTRAELENSFRIGATRKAFSPLFKDPLGIAKKIGTENQNAVEEVDIPNTEIEEAVEIEEAEEMSENENNYEENDTGKSVFYITGAEEGSIAAVIGSVAAVLGSVAAIIDSFASQRKKEFENIKTTEEPEITEEEKKEIEEEIKKEETRKQTERQKRVYNIIIYSSLFLIGSFLLVSIMKRINLKK